MAREKIMSAAANQKQGGAATKKKKEEEAATEDAFLKSHGLMIGDKSSRLHGTVSVIYTQTRDG